MTDKNIQFQLDMYKSKYNDQEKQKLIDSMSLQEKEQFYTFLILQKYEHLFLEKNPNIEIS